MRYLILGLFFISNAFAVWEDYSGDWKGNGKYLNRGLSYICEHYQISLDVTDTELSIFDGHYICKGKKILLKDRDYLIKGNQVFDQNQQIVGEITHKKILLKDQDPAYEIFFKRFEENLFVIESRVDDTQEEFMIGILK
jgi:hypothetical protein